MLFESYSLDYDVQQYKKKKKVSGRLGVDPLDMLRIPYWASEGKRSQ